MKLFFLPLPPAVLTALAAVALAFATGCTRSISNSGYAGRGYEYYGQSPYRGELSDFDVLGVDRDQAVSETEIANALNESQRVQLRRGDPILLIQSGAMFPDAGMADELGKFARVVPFTGMPLDKPQPGTASDTASRTSYAKSLRLAAARGGCPVIICYWGVLETARKELATKTVSWVPIVGWAIPDEKQHMRIRLKVAVIDVRTGRWSISTPEPFAVDAHSEMYRRESSDQAQVETLKQKAYEAAAKELLRTYGT